MKKINFISILLFLLSLLGLSKQPFAQNVGIGTSTPVGGLHIKGAADTTQLVIDANTTQSNTRPLIKLRTSTGIELLRIHSDDTSNLFIGRNAGRVNNAILAIGQFNTFIGGSAGRSNTSGIYNTATGESALSKNTTGDYNTACGADALIYNTTGLKNNAIGVSALAYNNTGNYNTANGVTALYSNTSGNNNTATGLEALFYNTTGNYNTAIGADALLTNTIGEFNTAIGGVSLFSNTAGVYNTACGLQTLYNNTTGNSNAAYGLDALYNNTTGSYNIAIGTDAVRANTTGHNNTGIGYVTLYNTTMSESNTAIGDGAGGLHNIGSFNTLIGAVSNCNGDGYFYSTALGSGSQCTASNQARIGSISTASIGGFANWTNISDGRVKKNIQDNVPGLAFINKLKPVTYNLDLNEADRIMQRLPVKDNDGKIIPASQMEMNARNQKEKIDYTGFIAQDVEKAAKEIGYDFSGVDAAKNDKDLYGLRYAEFVVPLVKAVQELSKQNDELLKRIEKLESLLTTKK